jgi:hypothetical protein
VCFEFLADYLGQLQRSLPYLLTWTVYPVTLFDIGLVHHAVDHYCTPCKGWKLEGSGVALSIARQLRSPIFLADLQQVKFPPEVDLANELLAEAQLSIFRRLPRLAVMNSFTALETMANFVFKSARTNQLTGFGVPSEQAEKIAEDERHSHRTDEKFLLHAGLQNAAARSLATENKALYDEMLSLEKDVRHKVTHRGVQPDVTEAKRSFKCACEVVRWLCGVAGLPQKPMNPPLDKSAPRFSASGNRESFVCSEMEMRLISQMIGVVSTSAPPCEPKKSP